MSKPPPEIHIESIEISVRGIAPAVVQSALSTLGPALQHALAAETEGRVAATTRHVDQVASPVLRVPGGADAAALRQAVARHVATIMAGRFTEPAGEP